METTKYIWLNGQFVLWEDAKTHIISHSLHYGSGVFEGIRAYKADKGVAIYRLKEHIDRLFFSADVMQMDIPYSKEEIMEATKELLRRNEIESCYIRPLANFGYGVMSVSSDNAPVDVSLSCWPWGAYLPPAMVDVKIVKTRRLSPNGFEPKAKISGHYVNSMMAGKELKGTKYQEAILLDEKGFLAEGPGENVFLVKDGKLFTPKLGSILAGITRDSVIHFAHDLDIEISECELTPEDAYSAEEAFYSGTAAEITPIHSIDDHVLGSGDIGPVTKRIKEIFLETTSGKNEKHQDWLAYI